MLIRIGVRSIRTFPFSSETEFTYDCVAYDQRKKRSRESQAEAVEQTNDNASPEAL